ncbi:MAG: xanthine dehydrogenase family protein subunit M [Acidobacteriota bacterium]
MTTTTVYSPHQLAEAYQLLDHHGATIKVLAGGTDLMVLYNSGTPQPALVLDIWRLDELREISQHDTYLKLGALCTYTQLINDQRVRLYAPALIDAARTIGAIQIQNRGTLGGNIVNGSPAGDSLPVLAAFDAEIEIGAAHGIRRVPFNQFYTGYRKTVLAPNELVLNILLPKQQEGELTRFYKVGTRAAQAISKVVMAVRARIDLDKTINSIAIALGSIAPTVIRARATEAAITGNIINAELIETARQQIIAEISPISDIRSTAHYRRVVTGNLIAKFLREA